MILLDTHVILWYQAGVRLRGDAMRAIAEASARNEIAISAISGWEIGMLASKGRIALETPASEYVRRLLRRPDVCEIPVSAGIGTRAAELSEAFEGDPADHLIVATAIDANCPLVTRDRRIVRFAAGSGGTVRAIAC